MAKLVSSWSKDPSRCVGAVLVDPVARTILSVGYNGFPRGVADDDRYNDRETKYNLVVHAEMNAIYNASYIGAKLNGSSLFVHGLPVCAECAKGIVQVGVKEIVMPKQDIPDHWKDSWNRSMALLDEAGIRIEFIEP